MSETTDKPKSPVTRTGIARLAATAWPWVASVAAIAVAAALWAGMSPSSSGSPEEAMADMRRSAREREVSKMIEALNGIESAAVLLKDAENGNSKGASVTVTMQDACVLTNDTAAAVAGLVASATPGLTPSDVIVVDSRNPSRAHRLAPEAEVTHQGAMLLRLRAQVEQALADKIRSFFAGMQIESVVVVSATLDFDRVKERMLELDPKQRGEIVISEERSTGAVVRMPAAPRSDGISANSPASLPSAVQPAPASDEFRKTESIVSYVTREIASTGKGISQLSASVVYFDRLVHGTDGKWEYDRSVETKKEIYRELVARALGAESRQIEMEYMKSPWATPPVSVAGTQSSDVNVYGVAGALGLAAVLAVFGLVTLLRRRGPEQLSAEAVETAAEAKQEDAIPATEVLRREATRLVSEDIEQAAAVLGRWVAREI